MKVRTAVLQDKQDIINIIAGAVKRMGEQGLDQWQKGYPSKEIIDEDIEKKQGYVAVLEDKTVGYMSLMFTDLECYENIDGSWADNGFYCSVHRLCVDGENLKAGIASAMLAAAELIAKEQGYLNMRIDTHKDNAAMRSVVEKNGYVHCGTIKLIGGEEDGAKREAYEKILK